MPTTIETRGVGSGDIDDAFDLIAIGYHEDLHEDFSAPAKAPPSEYDRDLKPCECEPGS